MTSQVEIYTKQVLKVVVAQICQTIGWNSIHQSSLEVLVDTLDRFLQELTKQTYRITELYQRTEPTLDDLSLAFHYLNVNLSDIKEYIDYVGPPEHVPAVPKYPAAPPSVLNVKRQHALNDEPYANPATVAPEAEDSEDEMQFTGFFQYNREYKTEITGGEANGTGAEVKKEENGTDDHKSAVSTDNKADLKRSAVSRIPSKRQVTMVHLANNGRITGVREGRLPGSDLPSAILSDLEPVSATAEPPEPPPPTKGSKSRGHKHQEPSKRDKLSQEPDKVKSNIFKKLVHPPKSSPQPLPPAAPLPASSSGAGGGPTPMEVIDIDSSPNPAPTMSPNSAVPPQPVSSSSKREKKQKKSKAKDTTTATMNSAALQSNLSHQQSILSTLSSIPALPAGTTLEAIPMKRERDRDPPPATQNPLNPLISSFYGSNMEPDFPPIAAVPSSSSSFFPSGPNFSLPQAPGLIPFGPLGIGIPNPLIPPVLSGLGKHPLFSQLSPAMAPEMLVSPKKEKESKKAKSQPSSLCNVPPLAPSNLFLPDTTVQVETVMKPEPFSPTFSSSAPPVGHPNPPLAMDPEGTIDLLTDEENDSQGSQSAAVAAAKKAEKAKKKEQRRLKKLLKSKKFGGDGGEGAGGEGGVGDEPIDLSGLDQEKQRKLEKKLKKLQKSNKAKLKAEAAEEKAVSLRGSPEPLLLPKLTLKLNSPKMTHSPKEFSAEEGGSGGGGGLREKHSSKDYRPLSIDTNEIMTPVKRLKAESLNSPVMRHDTAAMTMPAEPELAKISPLVTRPMRQQSHSAELASPVTSSSGRGRPKGSGKHQQAAAALSAIPMKTEVESSAGPGNQVWICPACGSVDDGSPMIGCDGCDAWYHWVCVGIHVAPDASEDWYCRVCISKRQEMVAGGADMGLADLAARKKEKKKRKKEKRMKMDDSP